MKRARAGTALLELVVALPLAALLATAAIQIMLTQLRVTRQVQARVTGIRELEHAAMVLAADLRPAAATDLESWSDTSVVLQAQVLTGIVCSVPAAHVIDVVGGAQDSPLRAVGTATPRAGDRVIFGVPDTAMLGTQAQAIDTVSVHATVASVALEPSACATSALHARAGGSPWRITLTAPIAQWPSRGDVIVLTRRTEWRAYRAGDQATYLGRRDWNGSAWSTIQPVVGPLRANALGGFVLRVLRADGSLLSSTHPDARLVQVRLASTHRSSGTHEVRDSLDLTLALRGGR